MKKISTVGILGGGQLARMLALAGYPLGLRFRLFDPDATACGGQVAPLLAGKYDDPDSLDLFTRGVDVVTYEFENVPVATARAIAEKVPVYPSPNVLEVTQDRLLEKNFFRSVGIPVPDYRAVETLDELRAAVAEIGLPAVLKTRRDGYDGKGQAVLRKPEDVDAAFAELGGRPLILEQFVAFDRELSVVAVRGRDGEFRAYSPVQNHHREGILRRTIAPAPDLDEAVENEAVGFAETILKKLDYVGVFALELFQVGGKLWANEMACRVHNSGHWTIEGGDASQFELHLRAICGLPLGGTGERDENCVMLNIIGEVPNLDPFFEIPGVHVHLYGKEPKPGRKIGHITLCGWEAELADDLAKGLEKGSGKKPRAERES